LAAEKFQLDVVKGAELTPPLEPHLAGLLEHRGAVGLEALAKQDVGLCEDLA
jgi:hypothetical protein